MKGLGFRLFNTQPGHKAALEEEERRGDREETGDRGDDEGIGLTLQRAQEEVLRCCGFIKLLV